MNHGIAVFPLECTTALPYMSLVQTVVETPEYLAAAKRAGMTDAERESAVNFIAANPDAGEIVPGTGGCRKVRVAKEGQGKSGGYRLITYYGSSNQPVFLLTVISKGNRKSTRLNSSH